jgi:uncharacterized membrane protein YoaK (UPF0700 family)
MYADLAGEAFVVGVVFGSMGAIALQDKRTFVPLFFVGIVAHLMFEVFGANRWYCKHGAACNVR